MLITTCSIRTLSTTSWFSSNRQHQGPSSKPWTILLKRVIIASQHGQIFPWSHECNRSLKRPYVCLISKAAWNKTASLPGPQPAHSSSFLLKHCIFRKSAKRVYMYTRSEGRPYNIVRYRAQPEVRETRIRDRLFRRSRSSQYTSYNAWLTTFARSEKTSDLSLA